MFSFFGMFLFFVLGFFVFSFLKKDKQMAMKILQDENVLYEELQKVKMLISGFKIIFFYELFFFMLTVFAFLEMQEKISSGVASYFMFVAWILLWIEFFFIVLCSALFGIRVSKQYHYVCNNYIVDAKVEKYENKSWICRIYRNGEYLAYLSQKPSSKKIKARVVDYDCKLKMYRLEEFVED